jgi:hypothetical protein
MRRGHGAAVVLAHAKWRSRRHFAPGDAFRNERVEDGVHLAYVKVCRSSMSLRVDRTAWHCCTG